MSFMDYSRYMINVDMLDARLKGPDSQKKYYDKWMKKYAGIFQHQDKNAMIEWDLRCKKALREIVSSATFFIEANKNLEMKCCASYYFCLYYSMFHAIYASIFLDADSPIDKLLCVTHRNIINRFISAFANSKTDLMTSDIKALFLDMKYKREYYSYVTPFNNPFHCEEDLEKLEHILLECYQLTSFHSLMVEQSYCKKAGSVVKLTQEAEIQEFDSLFRRLFSKSDEAGKNELDSSCEYVRKELLQHGFAPEYIALDLEHQLDEFHTYDGFYRGDVNENALNIRDIWSFISNALM